MKKPVQYRIRSKWCLALLLAVFAVTIYGQDFALDGIEYSITSTFPAEVEVTDYTGTETRLIIPPGVSYRGTRYAVTHIGNGAFQKNDSDPYKLEKVTIPGSVTVIGTSAFAWNNLAEVTFTGSSHLDTIAASAFSHNQLTRIEIPNTVNSIGVGAFSYNQLTSANIPDGVSVIRSTVFAYNQLASIEIPNRVTTIEISAFAGNDLESVTIPENVTSIGSWAFANNPGASDYYSNPVPISERGITAVFIKATNPPTIGANVFTTTFAQFNPSPYPNGIAHQGKIDLTVPEGARKTYIDTNWYGGTSYFKSITEVAKVNDEFTANNIKYKITALTPHKVEVTDYTGTETGLIIPPEVNHQGVDYTVTAIGSGAFQKNEPDPYKLEKVTIPGSVTTIGTGAFSRNNLAEVIFTGSSNLDTIAASAFSHNQLTRIEIPNTVNFIGSSAFSYNQLISANIPDGVSVLKNTVFVYNQLASIEIPNSVTTIEISAFGGNNLESVTIPENVTSIGPWAFANNPALNTVFIKAINPPAVENNIFTTTVPPPNEDRNGQIDLIVPKGTKSAYSNWYGGNNYFKSITDEEAGGTFIVGNITYKITSLAPLEVTATGYNTAGGTMVTIPPTVNNGPNTYTVTAIGDRAFRASLLGGPKLTNVEIPNSIKRIGDDAFYGNNLTSVEIPNSVTSIGQVAFGSNLLTNVTIPGSVKSISRWMFYGNQLTEVTLSDGVDSIGYQAFRDNPNLSLVTVERNDPPILQEGAFQNPSRDQIDLVVPMGKRQAYLSSKEWDGFRSISFGIFTVNDITYGITSPTEVMVVDYTGTDTEVEIPETVDDNGETYTVTAIGNGAFQEKGLTGVTISSSVVSIGSNAFNDNPTLRVLEVEATDPPRLVAATAFTNRNQIDVFVPMDALDAYNEPTNGWTGFRSITGRVESGDRFTVDHITYQVSHNIRSKTVVLMDYTGPGGVVTIPPTVDHGPDTFTVTLIWTHSFRFANLTQVTIPGSVETIMPGAFRDNPNLTLVTVERNDPPILREDAFQDPSRDQIDLVVPMGKRQAYLGSRGWDGFRSISFGIFTVNDITYGITSPTEVMVVDYTGTDTEVEIPETVNDRGTNYTVTAIGNGAFQEKGLTGVTISSNVVSIGSNAFNDNPTLGVLEVEATDPPRLVAANAFTNRNQIDVFVPSGALDAYNEPANGWTGFRSITGRAEIGDRFTVDHITYQVANNTLHKTVGLMDYTGPGGVVTIPPTVDHGLDNFTVFLIWIHSFRYANLTEVTIPGSVEMIMPQAFRDNPNLSLVTVERNDPPRLREGAFQDPGRDQIDLVVPAGRIQAYKNNGWNGFRSISDGTLPPQPTIDAPQSVDNLEPFTVNITFDGEVTGFELGDIQVTNATVSDLKGIGSIYTATLVPTSPCDDITIEVQANVAESTTTGFPNQAATQVIVAVVDTVDPTITCPADVVANTAHNGTGDCTITVDLGNPTVDDNCSVAAIVAQVNGMDIDPGTYAFGAGTTTVTWIVSDGTGNTASCEQAVTVEADGNCASATFTINAIVDVTIRENTVYTSVTPSLYGDDPKGTVTWTLGGTDAEAFSIDGSTGVVTMIARDFEAPADANADNVYEVSITATDSESNSSERSWTVTVQNHDIRFVIPSQAVPYSHPMIPTAFTPNGDGANDRWIIDNLLEDASVRIYDRHGTIIFSSEDGYTHPWDGTSRGRPLPAGSYLYAIQNGSHTYKGTVTILL